MGTIIEVYQHKIKALQDKVNALEAEKQQTENDIRTIVGGVRDIFEKLDINTETFKDANMALIGMKIFPKVTKNMGFIKQKWDETTPTLIKYKHLLNTDQ